ncbi:BQ2448_6789 [Microbotryum intermedium]|uniref:BQ2448_6789 protein n=1 Tax=Microbotryum intermedium TaxID=269621 RepID=A0A238FM54_9BASI|nr:BQ2448_6789 [Microbotryum intermedium]
MNTYQTSWSRSAQEDSKSPFPPLARQSNPIKRERSETITERNGRMLKYAKKKCTVDPEIYNPGLRAKLEARRSSPTRKAVADRHDDQDRRSKALSPPSFKVVLWEQVKVKEEKEVKIKTSITDSHHMDMDDDDACSVVPESPPPIPELARLFHDFECHRRSYYHVKPYVRGRTSSFDYYPDHSSLALRFRQYEIFLHRLLLEAEAVIKCPSSDNFHQTFVGAAAQNLNHEIENELEYVGNTKRCSCYSLFEEKEGGCKMKEEEGGPKRLIKFEV